MEYKKLNLKVPIENNNHYDLSCMVINNIDKIFKSAIKNNKNKIIINTNLKSGIPMENVNKIAGPFIEAWALETFTNDFEKKDNNKFFKKIEPGERLNMADIILDFKSKNNSGIIKANVDVKATSNDIKNSGKSPNITSFSRIRSE